MGWQGHHPDCPNSAAKVAAAAQIVRDANADAYAVTAAANTAIAIGTQSDELRAELKAAYLAGADAVLAEYKARPQDIAANAEGPIDLEKA
jgi:hypothetical protein